MYKVCNFLFYGCDYKILFLKAKKKWKEGNRMEQEEVRFQKYMQLSINHLDVPETKRSLYVVLEDILKNGKRRNVAIGGLRKVGKTTILKQLASAVKDSIYISLLYAGDVSVAYSIFYVLKKKVEQKEIKVVFLDEVTRMFYYDDKMQDFINFAGNYGVSVIFTASARCYLRQLAYGVLGARCVYLELPPISYYEYLYFKHPENEIRYYTTFYNGINHLKNVLQEFTKFHHNKASFYDYLDYCAEMWNIGQIEDYVESCYYDLIKSDLGLGIEQMDLPDTSCKETAKMLLYVFQYKLTTHYKSKKKFFDSANTYARERYSSEKLRVITNEEAVDFDTILHEYLEILNQKSAEELTDAIQILIQCGFVYFVESQDDFTSLSTVEERVREFMNGILPKKKDKIFSLDFTAADINIYLAIYKDFLSAAGMEGRIIDYLQGSALGEFIEFYIVTQMLSLSSKKYSIKRKLTDENNYAKEIDIVDETQRVLIEVGIGKKAKTELAFLDKNFENLHPEYKGYRKIYVSSNTRYDTLEKDSPYIEISYSDFGLLIDACVVGEYMRKLR